MLNRNNVIKSRVELQHDFVHLQDRIRVEFRLNEHLMQDLPEGARQVILRHVEAKAQEAVREMQDEIYHMALANKPSALRVYWDDDWNQPRYKIVSRY